MGQTGLKQFFSCCFKRYFLEITVFRFRNSVFFQHLFLFFLYFFGNSIIQFIVQKNISRSFSDGLCHYFDSFFKNGKATILLRFFLGLENLTGPEGGIR